MKISKKLGLSFGIIGILYIFSMVATILGIKKIDEQLEYISKNTLKGTKLISEINTKTSDHMILGFRHSTTVSTSDMDNVEAGMKIIEEEINKNILEYEKLLDDEAIKSNFLDFKKGYEDYLKIYSEFKMLSRANKNEEAQAVLKGPLTKTFDKYSSVLNEVVKLEGEKSLKLEENSKKLYKIILMSSIILTIIIVIIIISIILIMNKTVIRSINKVVTSLKDVSEGEGDLTNRIIVNSNDETKELAEYFNKFVGNTDKIFGEIKKNIENLASAATEISSQMTLVAEGNITQAEKKHFLEDDFKTMNEKMEIVIDSVRNQVAGTEEMSSTVSEMSGTINNVSKNTESTMKLSETSASSAKEGVELVEKTIEGMKRMTDITVNMDKMIEGVQGIAEQTNLLALNAAIEAARAGEAGKGFAVVAEEIRKLAETSNKFTGNIAKMVMEIREVGKVNSLLSEDAGKKLDEINEKVLRTNQEINDVGVSMEEQANAISEVASVINNLSDASAEIEVKATEQVDLLKKSNKNLDEISRLIDDATASTQETAAAAEELANLAENLNTLVSKFKTTSN
jgi:methyl-accepting chemotaxis protein